MAIYTLENTFTKKMKVTFVCDTSKSKLLPLVKANVIIKGILTEAGSSDYLRQYRDDLHVETINLDLFDEDSLELANELEERQGIGMIESKGGRWSLHKVGESSK